MMRVVKPLGVAFVFLLAWVGALVLTVSSCDRRIRAIPRVDPKGSLEWSASSGKPVPEKFVVLLVPKDGAVMRSLEGGPDEPMLRAVHTSVVEDASGTVTLACNTRKFEIDRRSLALATPGEETDRLIGLLVAEYRSRPGATNDFRMKLQRSDDAPDAVSLTVRSSERITDRYTYRVTESGAVPIRSEGYSFKEEVLESRPGEDDVIMDHTVIAAIATAVMSVVGGVVVWRVR